MRYRCPDTCVHDNEFERTYCPLRKLMDVCIIHFVEYEVGRHCPVCGAYIAAGL